MRNFYTALDYDNNLIIVGANKGSSEKNRATIHGKIDNPVFPNEKKNQYWWILIVMMILAFVIACGFFLHQDKKAKTQRRELEEALRDDRNIPGLVDK